MVRDGTHVSMHKSRLEFLEGSSSKRGLDHEMPVHPVGLSDRFTLEPVRAVRLRVRTPVDPLKISCDSVFYRYHHIQ